MTYHQANENILYFSGLPCVLVRFQEMDNYFTLMIQNWEPTDCNITDYRIGIAEKYFAPIKKPNAFLCEFIGPLFLT